MESQWEPHRGGTGRLERLCIGRLAPGMLHGICWLSEPWSGPDRSWDQLLEGRVGQSWGQMWTPEEALLESRETARLADEYVGYLAHLDADEEHGIASILLIQALAECLWTRKGQREPQLNTGPLQAPGTKLSGYDPLKAPSPSHESTWGRGKQHWQNPRV